MEISPAKLLAACGVLFAGIIGINFLSQYKSNADFRASLSGVNFDSLRSRLIKEEGLASPETDILEDSEVFYDNDTSDLIPQED